MLSGEKGRWGQVPEGLKSQAKEDRRIFGPDRGWGWGLAGGGECLWVGGAQTPQYPGM